MWMHTANMMIVFALFASFACAELDLSTVESHGPPDAPRTDGQLRMRNEKLRVEGLSNARMSVDGNKAIEAAEAKEVAHKSRTPKQRLALASKTPLTIDIEDSHTREKQLKESKIKREEKQAKELRAKQEREAKRVAELKAKEGKAKEQEAKDKEKAAKAAAKALAEKNERSAKKDVADEKEQKKLAAIAKEKSDKDAAALAVEQEKQAKSKEKLDKVQAVRAKLVKDKKDAEQTLIDGPKQIRAARKKIGKAKDVLAHLHATSPEGIAEAKKEREEKAKEKAAKETEAKAKAKAAEIALKKKLARDKEKADKVAERGVKLAKQQAAAEVASKAVQEKKAKAKAAAEKELDDKDKEKKAKEKAAKKDQAEKAAKKAVKDSRIEQNAKNSQLLADQAASEKQQQLAKAVEFEAKADAKKAEEAKDKKAAAVAGAAAKIRDQELKAAQAEQDKEAAAAAKEAELDAQAEAQMKKDHAARDALETAGVEELEKIRENKLKKDAKKEAAAELKFQNARSAELKKVAAGKVEAQKAKIQQLQELESKKQEAAQAVGARASKEKAAKEAAKEAAEVKEGDRKRKALIEAEAMNEKTEKDQEKMKRELMKQSMAKMNKLKADVAAAQDVEHKRKAATQKKMGKVNLAMNKEKAFKIKTQQEAEKAYMAMMNDPLALLKHLDKLGKQYMLQVALGTQQVASDDAQKLIIDKMVIDLRAEQEAGEAEEMKSSIHAAMTDEQRKMRTEMRSKNKATRLRLSGSAAVDQLGNLERLHPNMRILFRDGISKFNKARAMVDRFQVLTKQSEKKAKLKGKEDLINLEQRQKEEKMAANSFSFKACECTTKLTKLELMYTGQVPVDAKIQAGDKTCFEGTAMSEQTIEIEQLSGTSLFIDSGSTNSTVNLNCSLPVFVGQTFGDWKVFEAESENGVLCDRPSPRQLTNKNSTVARTAAGLPKEEGTKLTTHEHFSAMVAKLHELAKNWDSAVKSPVVEETEPTEKLTPEQLAEQQAKAKFDAERSATEASNLADMDKRPAPDDKSPAPQAAAAADPAASDVPTMKLQQEAAQLSGAAQQEMEQNPEKVLEVLELGF